MAHAESDTFSTSMAQFESTALCSRLKHTS